jgi:hypothetical protein
MLEELVDWRLTAATSHRMLACRPGVAVKLALAYGLVSNALAPADRIAATAAYNKSLALWEQLRDSAQIASEMRHKPAAPQQAPTRPRLDSDTRPGPSRSISTMVTGT